MTRPTEENDNLTWQGIATSPGVVIDCHFGLSGMIFCINTQSLNIGHPLLQTQNEPASWKARLSL